MSKEEDSGHEFLSKQRVWEVGSCAGTIIPKLDGDAALLSSNFTHNSHYLDTRSVHYTQHYMLCGDHSPHYLLLNVSLNATHSVAHDIDPGHHKKSPLSSPHCQMLTTRLYEALYTAAAATCSSQASELQANNSHFKYTHKHTHFCSGDKWNDGKRKMFLPPFIPKISMEFVFRNIHKRIHFSHTASLCWIRGLITPLSMISSPEFVSSSRLSAAITRTNTS